MSRRCELSGKGVLTGNRVSHSNIKTRRRYLPNLQNVTLQSETLGRSFRFRVAASALRTVDQTGYGEIPGVGHQGGSSLAVSRNSKHPDAAWIFMQWATSYDTQVLITALGGGTGPTRTAVYDDPRIIANNRVGPGTTRHLSVVRETIANDMGSEPDLPEWAELSNDTIPVRLGKYFAGEYASAKEAMDDIAQAADKVVGG